jgi:hypothetical protein
MAQLPESNLSVRDRLVRIRDSVEVGCARWEVLGDLEVILSVIDLERL